MNIDKFTEIFEIIKRAISTIDISLKSKSSLNYEEKMNLLELLVQTQSLHTSLRSDFIEQTIYLDQSLQDLMSNIQKLRDQLVLNSGITPDNNQNNLILFDRRQGTEDRRQLHTFIDKDRRSGNSDRRDRPVKRS